VGGKQRIKEQEQQATREDGLLIPLSDGPRKEGNLSERPRERRNDTTSTDTATATSRARDLLVMLIQLSVVKLARCISTTDDPPPEDQRGKRRAPVEPLTKGRHIPRFSPSNVYSSTVNKDKTRSALQYSVYGQRAIGFCLECGEEGAFSSMIEAG
jgi:hypothetical protein